MLYSICPLVVTLFLLDTSDSQFLFSLLPVEKRGSVGWVLVGVVVEFRSFHFLASMAHFGAFHCVTFLRMTQTSLAHATDRIK